MERGRGLTVSVTVTIGVACGGAEATLNRF